MALLDRLSEEACWQQFYEYKCSLHCPKDFAKELKDFMDRKVYLPVLQRIAEGEPFPLPKKTLISKMSSQKVRTVYTYPKDENTVLKLLTWLLLRKYDGLFSKNLYSFRPGISAKDAIRRLTRVHGLYDMYAYKADISNYFNSIPIEAFLPRLREALADDPETAAFLAKLLQETEVLDRGVEVVEEKGVMAGTPLSAFYANLYLRELDLAFEERGIPYARYSDDIIVFAEDRGTLQEYASEIRAFLSESGLTVNPKKEQVFTPDEGFTFLGFHLRKGIIDIAPATITKLKGKMRRKRNALHRWQQRNGRPGEDAAKAFIRIFNRKLLESPMDSDLSWSYWFFSVINSTEGLREIDRYAQDCLRYLISGTHRKARYNVRYRDLQTLGYQSLVHAYYEGEKDSI